MAGSYFEAFGARIREIRQRAGLTVRETAAKAGVNKNTILRIEAGKPLRFSTMEKVCEALGIVPGTPPSEGLSVRGQHFAAHRSSKERWVCFALDDPLQPSRVYASKTLASPQARKTMGSQGAANMFMKRLGSHLPGGRLNAAIFEVFASSGWAKQMSGEAFVMVLQGALRFHVGEESFELSEGESAVFARDVLHMHEPVGRTLPAVMLYVQAD